MADKNSQVFKAIKPYIVSLVGDMIDRRGTSGGGGSAGGIIVSGTPSPHALSSVHHTGVLVDSQAPQFLLASGTRPLTGNLAVASGVTIDGEDISALGTRVDFLDARTVIGGAGLTSSGTLLGAGDPTLAVGAGTGITVAADSIAVDQTYAFVWAASHTFNADIQLNADLDFIGTRTITTNASNHLNFAPGGDLVLGATKTDRSSDYADGIPIAGYSFHINTGSHRQLTTHTIKADELHVRVFIADTVRVDIGEEYWGKSMGIVYADFTTPGSIGGTVVVTFEDSVALTGAVFANSDWIMISTVDIGTGLEVNQIWGQVSGYTDLGADINGVGRQSWTFTLRVGPTGLLVKKGRLAVDFGVSGQGYVHLSTLDSADGPWIQIGTWSGANPYTAGNREIRTQIGNLISISDPDMTPVGFGLFSDNAYLRGIVRTPNAILSDNGVVVFNATQTNYNDLDAYKFARDNEVEYGGLYGYWQDLAVDTQNITLRILPSAHANTLTLQSSATSGGTAVVFLEATNSGLSAAPTQIRLERSASVPSTVSVQADNFSVTLNTPSTGLITMGGLVRPGSDSAYDLGTASLKWRTLYADSIVATTITGASVGGQTWTYPASMVIDAVAASDTLVSVANSGAGRADLAVDRNITLGGTVDGVDISAHAANANAHHNQVHVLADTSALGPDHSVSGLTSGFVLVATAATAAHFSRLAHSQLGSIGANDHHNQSHVLATNVGLGADHTMSGAVVGHVLRATSATTADFEQLQHADLGGVTANQHHNQSHVLATNAALGADHTISGAVAGQVLRASSATAASFQTLAHSDLTGVTANQHHNQIHDIVGGDHTISGSTLQVVGATATNTLGLLTPSAAPGAASAILKSTSAGGLTLETLTVQGDVNITGVGDLYVAGSVGGASGIIVTLGDRVGFGRIPDPQFTVDVNGPLRADYLIGRHAIQLDNAYMIAHYDGAEPYNSNISGEPNGHMGQIGTMAGGVTFRQGKFGKAVIVAEAASTNLITNAIFSTDTSGWTSSATSIARSAEDSHYGSYSLKITPSTAANQGAYYAVTLTASTTYTFSMWFRGLAGLSYNIYAYDVAVGGTGLVTWVASGEWERRSTTWTTAAGTAWRMYVERATAGTTTPFYVDEALLEQKAYVTPYPTSAWTAGRLSYAPGEMNLALPRTIMAWVYLRTAPSGGFAVPFYATDGANLVYIRYNFTNDRWEYTWASTVYNTGGATVSSKDAWHHIALTRDALGALAFYVDGELLQTGTAGNTNLYATFDVGSQGGTIRQWNERIDDFVIVNEALSATEILSIVESDAPVFAESSVFSFRATPLGLVWADEKGLWMRNAAGGAVLGAFGGVAATESWGGMTLSQSDVLIGDNSRGAFMLWDDSAGTLVIGGAGAGDSYLALTGANVTLYTDSTERVKLTGAGVLTINDSGGAAVFTFNASAGAEFTKPLTLGTNGGIWQGSGTFASPTTGLKIFNSSGIGKLSTYNAGVEQVKIDTDGKMYAGAGNVRLDASGIALFAQSTEQQASSLTMFDVSTQMGIITPVVSGTVYQMYLRANPTRATKDGIITLQADGGTGKIGRIELSTVDNNTGSQTAYINIGSNTGGGMYVTPKLRVSQLGTTSAIPALYLEQLDLSEEYFEFNGTVAAGNPIDTAAIGTYYGKVRVSVNGTFKFMALYNS